MNITMTKIWIAVALLVLIGGLAQAQSGDRADSAFRSGQLVIDSNPYLAKQK